jgi:hypothetical protein
MGAVGATVYQLIAYGLGQVDKKFGRDQDHQVTGNFWIQNSTSLLADSIFCVSNLHFSIQLLILQLLPFVSGMFVDIVSLGHADSLVLEVLSFAILPQHSGMVVLTYCVKIIYLVSRKETIRNEWTS